MTPYWLLLLCWLWIKVVRVANWFFGVAGRPGLFSSEIGLLTADLAGASKWSEPFDPLEELLHRTFDQLSPEGQAKMLEIAKEELAKEEKEKSK